MGDILTTVLLLLGALRKPSFYRVLAGLIHKIDEWMDGNSHVSLGLECLHDAPDFTHEEEGKFSAEIALYRRADAGRLLVKEHCDRLRVIQLMDDPLFIKPLLEATIRALKQWRA
jgi:hypothetical protein